METVTMHERIAQYGVRMTAAEVAQRPARDAWDGPYFVPWPVTVHVPAVGSRRATPVTVED